MINKASDKIIKDVSSRPKLNYKNTIIILEMFKKFNFTLSEISKDSWQISCKNINRPNAGLLTKNNKFIEIVFSEPFFTLNIPVKKNIERETQFLYDMLSKNYF